MAQCTTALSFGAPRPLVALGAGVGWECSLASACPLPSAGGCRLSSPSPLTGLQTPCCSSLAAGADPEPCKVRPFPRNQGPWPRVART